MYDKNSVMLRLLLNRYHSGEMESLLKSLPEEESQQVLNIPIESRNVAALLKSPQEAIKKIHYSWLIPKAREIDKKRLPLILALLPEPHASKLRDTLNETSEPLQLSAAARKFLKSELCSLFQLDEVLPAEYLPETDMSPLLDLQKRELVDLIDFLGLYDLAEEIHHLVNRKLLEQIYQCLTTKKKKFLRVCLHQKEKLVSQKLQLENWDGDSKKLIKLLHHKGMVRLGYALSGQHPDFIWHVSHILDTGRGEKLSRYCSQKKIPGVTDTLKKQVKQTIAFFKETGTT